jgi:serine/threonine protein kinase
MKAKEGANVAATQTLLEKKLALLNDAKQRARRDVAAAFENSNLKDHVRDYPQFDKSELTLGKFLGKGGFGSVYEVLAFEDGSAHPVRGRREEEDEEVEGVESRRFMAEHGIRNDGDCRYAVRFLKPDVIKDPERFYLGMMDMAVLTKFLSSVDHPNIIKLRATAKCDIYSADYFLVLDALYGTLDKRIRKWSVSKERFSGMMGKYITDKKGKKAQDLWKERLAVAYDVSKALAYLHEQK